MHHIAMNTNDRRGVRMTWLNYTTRFHVSLVQLGGPRRPKLKQDLNDTAITIRIIKVPLLPSICEAKAIAKLSEAIRAPGPRARGRRSGRDARRAARGARRPRGRKKRHPLSEATFLALMAGALRTPAPTKACLIFLTDTFSYKGSSRL